MDLNLPRPVANSTEFKNQTYFKPHTPLTPQENLSNFGYKSATHQTIFPHRYTRTTYPTTTKLSNKLQSGMVQW